MKKSFLYAFWLDFFIIMLIPFVFVFSARFNRYDVFDRIAGWAMLWLAAAFVFIAFSAMIGAKVKKFPATTAQQKKNSMAVIFIAALSFFGIVLSFLRTVLSVEYFWDALMIYWVIFTAFLSRMMRDFITLCQYDVPRG